VSAESPAGPSWLKTAQRLRAIAQTGLSYTRDEYDRERYREVGSLAQGMLAGLLDLSPDRIEEAFSLDRGYPTPKTDVRMAAFRGDRILLVREAADGGWTMPGGWADESDSLREAVEREAEEESGFVIQATRLIAVKDRSRHPYRPRQLGGTYKLFFLGEIQGGEARISHETSAVDFFSPESLPPLSQGRTLPEDVQQAVAARGNPTLETIFD
jgi:ADP-ribose pyrophosphatase YjhB (NUDIX family)